MTERFDKFTERARKVLQFAQEEAQRLNHNYIGTEHFLLGLVREGDGVAAQVLRDLGIELQKVRSAVEFVIGRGDRNVIGDIGLTPRAKRVIELAVEESRRLNHNYIGTEHLLLGLLLEGEGIAAGVLESLGVSLEKVGGKVMEALKIPEAYSPPRTGLRYGGFWNRGQSSKDVDSDELHWQPYLPTSRVSVELIRTLFDYSFWARDKLLGAISGLEASSLKQSEVKGVYGSIHDTFAHLAASEWLWLQRCQGESPMETPKGEDFDNLPALIQWWDDIHAQVVDYLNTINEADLEREITYSAADGKVRTRKVWHMLLQVTNHQTEHRAQIASMLGQLGVEVPQTDLVVYLSEQT